MTKISIESILEEAKSEIAGLKAISIVEVETGLARGSLTIDNAFDLEAASAYNSEVLKAKIKAKNAMGMQKEAINIIIIELSNQIHIIQPSGNAKFLVYIATDSTSSNLGIARKVALSIGKKVEEVLS